jgi:DNA processing protein
MQNIREINKQQFPKRLLEIPDCPKKLFIKGEFPPEEHKFLAVVGSRKYSDYGKFATEKIIEGLKGYPIVIISGLALGIDSIAHRAALSAGLKTIAVPGSGLDPKVLYPASHQQLAEKIISSHGALISEFEPMFKATPYSFPQRNRIMAGLSDAVLVIEAELKSGTLITSKYATEYNRDVYTIPGSIFSPTSAGPHMLLRLGATPITKSEDVLDALGLKIDAQENVERNYDDCSPIEMKILAQLNNPRTKDELAEMLEININELNSMLTLLEIKGLIGERLGKLELT